MSERVLDVALVEEPTRESLIEAIWNISYSLNCDFNGENGEEYLSDEAKKRGFKTDLDMVIHDVNESTENDCDFLYYVLFSMLHGSEWQYETVTEVINNEVKIKCFAVVCEW